MTRSLTRARALEAFAEARRCAGCARATIAFEQRLLRAALPRLKARSLARVTRADVEAYLASRARQVRATTVSRELTVLRSFFAFLVREGLLALDPAQGLTTRPGTPRPPLLLSRASVGALLQTALLDAGGRRSASVRRARALRDRALLELLYGLGLRASEAAAVRLADLDLVDAALLVRRAKRGQHRWLPLPPAALLALRRYLREGRPFLLHTRGDEDHLFLTERATSLSGNGVLRIVKLVARRAGLRAHPHALRRALATHLVQNGVSLVCVRELLGHVRLDTTQRYVLVERDDLRRAVDHLDRSDP